MCLAFTADLKRSGAFSSGPVETEDVFLSLSACFDEGQRKNDI